MHFKETINKKKKNVSMSPTEQLKKRRWIFKGFPTLIDNRLYNQADDTPVPFLSMLNSVHVKSGPSS